MLTTHHRLVSTEEVSFSATERAAGRVGQLLPIDAPGAVHDAVASRLYLGALHRCGKGRGWDTSDMGKQ